MTRFSNHWFALLFFLVLCLGTGIVGGFATANAVDGWYTTINRPEWNPPSWVFAPVWTTLYVMMAVAAWLVWRKDVRFSGVRLALILFFLQLFLNFIWPFIFFSAQSIGWALVDICALFVVLALTAFAFFGISRPAGLLMLPYLGWAGFAGFLNYTIWTMN